MHTHISLSIQTEINASPVHSSMKHKHLRTPATLPGFTLYQIPKRQTVSILGVKWDSLFHFVWKQMRENVLLFSSDSSAVCSAVHLASNVCLSTHTRLRLAVSVSVTL